MARESVLEKQAIEYAESRNWLYRKVRWIGRRGAPDRIFIRDGSVIFVEFKQKGRKPTVQQQREIDRMRKAGAVVRVIDDYDIALSVFV